jgi:RNA ligase (TIGR02306 family)
MSNFKVSKEKIELFSHPNADALQIGKIGSYQVIVKLGDYNDGDEVIFAPEKSILSGNLKSEWEKYLVGPNKDRVKAVRLRGEISSGIIIPKEFVTNFDSFRIGEDIAEHLGIKMYVPEIPKQLMGTAESFTMPFVGQHDCEHARVYANELIPGERIVITEKLHGSLVTLAYNFETDETIVTSKGLLKSGLTIKEDENNAYWIAVRNCNILDIIKENYKDGVVQVFGEIIPVQKGYTYGQENVTLRLFDVRVNGKSKEYDNVAEGFKKLWVPIIYDGECKMIEKEVVLHRSADGIALETKTTRIIATEIVDLCKGDELVSGKKLHIREGIVVRPYKDRLAKDGSKLRLKILNPEYKETGEEFN